MSSELGKDYFLSALPLNDAVKNKPHKDVTVSESTLKQLEALGLIKKTKTDV